jgi:hypothetical protein
MFNPTEEQNAEVGSVLNNPSITLNAETDGPVIPSESPEFHHGFITGLLLNHEMLKHHCCDESASQVLLETETQHCANCSCSKEIPQTFYGLMMED